MGTRSNPTSAGLNPADDRTDALAAVADALERLRYGVIQLTVHDGKLMQIDVTERRRFAG